MEEPNFNKIAQKWQKRWHDKKAFKSVPDREKEKFYCLEMFCYPSGAGLHMGHVRNFAIGDSYARYKRMRGYNVLYPVGFDAFGLPAENAAIKNKVNPKKWTEDQHETYEHATENARPQLRLGQVSGNVLSGLL